jgi:ubiquitin-protein ligase
VDLEGNVCLNILREDWKPVLNLNSVMVGLQYLFLEPNADDPLNKGEHFFHLFQKYVLNHSSQKN